ncbi:hypothetical protein IHI24_000485 [Rickettsia endosymbiont of Cardiosporidium cionae]|nr:hypothetical protein IHI24_000485 [Rickettsia endosymbiont of Cardiosporidium cionae]
MLKNGTNPNTTVSYVYKKFNVLDEAIMYGLTEFYKLLTDYGVQAGKYAREKLFDITQKYVKNKYWIGNFEEAEENFVEIKAMLEDAKVDPNYKK